MKKLKMQYKYPKAFEGSHCYHVFFVFLRSYVHKKFSTRQEKSFHSLHRIEYKEYPLKLRVARGKQLAEPWDDYPFHGYDIARSWKHNSRRKRQYYRSLVTTVQEEG